MSINNFGSKYFSKIVLDSGVNNSVGSILFEFHVVLDLCDGNLFGGFVGINDESSRVGKLWIKVTLIFGGTGVTDD